LTQTLLPGKSFEIYSARIAAEQHAGDSQITFTDFPDFKPRTVYSKCDFPLALDTGGDVGVGLDYVVGGN
jgi:hypothetical protein